MKKLQLLMIGLLFTAASLSLQAAEPTSAPTSNVSPLPRVTIFSAKKLGFTKCRIPCILAAKDNVLIAWTEARTGATAGDWDPSYEYISRSFDNGATWETPRQINGNGVDVFHNCVMMYDRDTQIIHCFYCVTYKKVMYMQSTDNGKTFSEAKDVTDVFTPIKKEWDWKVIGIGPNHGIQLRNGRLMVTFWMSTVEHHHYPDSVAVLYSDDHGKTWKTGDLAIKHSKQFPTPNETVAAELDDGSVMLNARSGVASHHRIKVVGDGISKWSQPTVIDELVEPNNNAAMIRYCFPEASDPGLILFANPNNITIPMADKKPEPDGTYSYYARRNLTIFASYDDGKTWPVSRPIMPGSSGYSDLVVCGNSDVGCIYESTDDFFVHFPLKWIDPNCPVQK